MIPDTRKRILLHAAKLFAQNGYEGVRTKEIAKASEISEVTLFKYFPKKEILYHTLLDEFFQTVELSSLVDDLDYSNLFEDLLKIANVIAKNSIANIDIILMRQKEKTDFLSDKKFDISKDPSYLKLLTVLESYAENNMISADPTIAANLFITSIIGSFHLLSGNHFNESDYLNYIENFVKIFSKGIQ